MAEDLIVSSELTKEEKYKTLLPQLKALVDGETDAIANLANIAAALKTTFNFWWVGFYLVKNNELVLGPFQGPVACTRIAKGKGVCGSSWQKKEVIIVPDVDQFPGHIACSSASKSEIVLPRLNSQNEVEMVLDVDSEFLNHFDETDQNYLLKIIQLIPTLN
ncbi:MAG TPA: GAF domain-containing protein [Vicingus sp.]|nr:GAF domain-containing protein [Flavobacteriales bacterium]HRN41945.1 GAF domain-containing protein [Vicingus sp.]HRP60237.1 GAF domain-containing protein [Vicingus sp.]